MRPACRPARSKSASARPASKSGSDAVGVAPPLGHLHHVEDRADHLGVGAQRERPRHREAERRKRGQQAIFAVDRMRRLEQLPERLAAQHIVARRRVDPVGRVRLARREFGQLERPAKPSTLAFEPRPERRFVQRRARSSVLLELHPRDRPPMHFVGPVGEPQRAHRRPGARPAGSPPTRPPPPCAWIASSSTFSAVRGAATLIIAISPCAALLPTRSIMSAALRHSSRVISISIRASAIRSSHTDCSDRRLAERGARHQPLGHQLDRFLGDPDHPHAMVDPPRPQPPLRDLEPAPFAEQHVRRRHPHLVERRPPYGRAARRHNRTPADAGRPSRRRRRAAPGSSIAACGCRRPGRSCP